MTSSSANNHPASLDSEPPALVCARRPQPGPGDIDGAGTGQAGQLLARPITVASTALRLIPAEFVASM